METPEIMMGKMPSQPKIRTKLIEFLITEDCNLRCSYCYLVGKNSSRKMSVDLAKKAVDFVLEDKTISDSTAVVWSMGGGEALLEIEKIDALTDYIKYKTAKLNHPWKDNYTILIGSNGVLYDTPKVQAYLKKNSKNVQVAITIDGTKEKHDGARKFPDGSGSYDKIVPNVKLWINQFPFSEKVTKATFSHADLPYVKDSIISLWNLGIDFVMANVVFEDVWQEGDEVVFETQLKELADYVLENEIWKSKTVRFFDPNMGFPLLEEERRKGFCGSGKHMLAIDCDGKIYPCIRFTGYSLSQKKKPLYLGDIYRGINQEKLRKFLSFSLETISSNECVECEVASSCSYCSGFNYDAADENTIFKRATNLCKMHKANVRACEYFWDEFEKVTGLKSPRTEIKEARAIRKEIGNKVNSLIFILDDSSTPYCRYTPRREFITTMDEKTFKKGLEFVEKNCLNPILLGDHIDHYSYDPEDILITSSSSSVINENTIVVFNEEVTDISSDSQVCIIQISKKTISRLHELVMKAKKHFERINIIINDIDQWGDYEIEKYTEQLNILSEMIVNDAKIRNYYDINILTDLLKLKNMCNCDAGEETYTLAPNGKIYICPAFYFDDPDNFIGSLEEGIKIKNEYLLTLKHAPICSRCDAYHCNRCKFLNYKITGEINTPSRMQCIISHIERNASRNLQLMLQKENMVAFMDILPEKSYRDPFEILLNEQHLDKW